MSMMYCDHCGEMIDTDFNLEHFTDEDLTTCEEVEEEDEEDPVKDLESQLNHYKNLLRNIDNYPAYNRKNVEVVISELESRLKDDSDDGPGELARQTNEHQFPTHPEPPKEHD